MITELRELGRNGLAKQRWPILLDNVDFTTQLKLSEYAKNQQWFELAVDASIVAKAWDYLSLRLPNAYSEYFNAALQNLNISKTLLWQSLVKKVLGIQWHNLQQMRGA